MPKIQTVVEFRVDFQIGAAKCNKLLQIEQRRNFNGFSGGIGLRKKTTTLRGKLINRWWNPHQVRFC